MINRTTFHFGLVFSLLLGAAVVGCGGPDRPANFPDIYPCTLTFVQEGQPVAGVNVMLFSKGEPCPWVVSSITDEAGNASLRTHAKYDGCPKGTWTIVATKEEIADDPGSESEGDDGESGGSGDIYTLINPEYTSRDTSTLEITIEGKTKQTIDLGPAVHELIGNTSDI